MGGLIDGEKKVAEFVIGLIVIVIGIVAFMTLLMFWFELQDLRREHRLISTLMIWGYGIGVPLALRWLNKVRNSEDDWVAEPDSIGSDGYPNLPVRKESRVMNFAFWGIAILWIVCCIFMIQDVLAVLSQISSSCPPDDYACQHPGRF